MPASPFSPDDLRQISDQGLGLQEVESQMSRLARGMRFLQLERPCRIGDGIRRLHSEELGRYGRHWDRVAAAGTGMKFVPASGAGTRMFQNFLRGLHEGIAPALGEELRQLDRFPFYPDLQATMQAAGLSLEESLRRDDFKVVLEFLLTPRGLNYAALPKALIPFHRYPGRRRNPLEEQVVEAAGYLRDARGLCRLHFTVSEEHEAAIRDYWRTVASVYTTGDISFEIDFSVQARSSDTIAVDLQNQPFRDQSGHLLFRPGGHGALLHNLGRLDASVVFIKNIDNVAPDNRKVEAEVFKKAMAGVLLEVQETCFRYLQMLEAGTPGPASLAEMEAFFSGILSGSLPTSWPDLDAAAKAKWIFAGLNRPLRVCGMVPTQGEPGGAPFWVEERHGGFSLQIVESAQVDPGNSEQQGVFRSSTHFNPVELVCGLKDFRGKLFDLKKFADPDAGFIAEKSYQGRPLKALELPGLWNGGMARWNTIFVEVPAATFTPVKKIEDLLRPEHQ